MPTQKDDRESSAQQIAMEVCSRRRSGEVVPDEQVLRDNPGLRDELIEQLSRLKRLETARQHALESPAEFESSDEVDLAATFENPVEVASPPGIGRGPFRPSDQAAANDKFPSKPAGDEVRITLQEQSKDGDFRSTMLIHDESQEAERLEEQSTPLYRPSVRQPMAVLKLFHDGMPTFNQYPVFADRFRIGRTEGDLLVPHDFWMSGRHAEIQRRAANGQCRWFLVDLKSTNGTFLQSQAAKLQDNDELFLGQERYRFVSQNGRSGLLHVTKGTGQQWWFNKREERIGRKGPCGLQAFSTDPYLNSVHAELKQNPEGEWWVHDCGSQNGVWLRVKEVELLAEQCFQLGEQRFGFWCPTGAGPRVSSR